MNDSLIEGISDSVLFSWLLSSVIVLAFLLWSKFHIRNQIIHPVHQDAVQAVREHVIHGESNRQPRNGDDQCPVCIDHLRFAVETNCGHVFCCACMMAYWEQGAWIGAMKCPICRQQINVLLPMFTNDEAVSNEFTIYNNKIHIYNRRFSGQPRSILEYILDAPVLVRHLWRNFFTASGIVLLLRIRIIIFFCIVLLYLWMPFDIIPESVVGVLGFIDDVLFTLAIVLYVTVLFRQSLAQ
ncbi:E3 ubiquitin-protein ligase RNF170 [Hydra vulgaris]|uniref:E3 ubiquitin-protein ligase RNF170 n=1 Tax=Hydra vulgaris TaxID=6087 RepID=A0ABM4DJ45_HYDVU